MAAARRQGWSRFAWNGPKPRAFVLARQNGLSAGAVVSREVRAKIRRRLVQSLKDPNNVAAIVNALRHVHGDAFARYLLTEGMTLTVLIDTMLGSPLKNRDAIKLITRALQSGDFIITPEILSTSHLTYVY